MKRWQRSEPVAMWPGDELLVSVDEPQMVRIEYSGTGEPYSVRDAQTIRELRQEVRRLRRLVHQLEDLSC